MPVTGNTPTDIGDIPQASAIVPGNPTPVLLEGSTNVSTDNNDNTVTALSVNIKEIGYALLSLGQKLKAASIPVVLPSDQTVPVSFGGSLPAGTNVIGHVIVDSAGNVSVTSMPSLPAGSNLIGHVIIDSGSISVNTISNYAAESGGNLAAAKADLDTIVTNTNKIPASPATEGGNLATLVPGVQGWIAATGNGTANQENVLTFAQQVRKVVVYNASANNVPLEFDQTASATSIPIPPGAYWIIDNVLCTTVHIFPSVLLPINTTSGLYVKGWK